MPKKPPLGAVFIFLKFYYCLLFITKYYAPIKGIICNYFSMSINVGSHIGEGAESIGRLPSSRRLKNITPEGILSQEVMRVT